MHTPDAIQPQDCRSSTSRLNIIVPLFNEAEMLPLLMQRLENVVQSIDLRCEVIMVDDGSTDHSWPDICHYQPHNFDLKAITLSRNFGKEAALSAGLKAVTADVIILLDADCQDPPELIPQMLEAWKAGAEIVNMKRRTRSSESWFKRQTAKLFYRLLSLLSDPPVPENVGDFRLLSRRVVDEINQLGERNLYMKGLLSWPGFYPVTIDYERQQRLKGSSKWSYWRLMLLAISGITAFSNRPLRLASWIGALVAVSAFVYASWVLFRTLLYGDPVSGYPSMIIIILFIGGIQLITIGILGEYIGRIFTEVKGRPNFIVRETRTEQARSQNRQHPVARNEPDGH